MTILLRRLHLIYGAERGLHGVSFLISTLFGVVSQGRVASPRSTASLWATVLALRWAGRTASPKETNHAHGSLKRVNANRDAVDQENNFDGFCEHRAEHAWDDMTLVVRRVDFGAEAFVDSLRLGRDPDAIARSAANRLRRRSLLRVNAPLTTTMLSPCNGAVGSSHEATCGGGGSIMRMNKRVNENGV